MEVKDLKLKKGLIKKERKKLIEIGWRKERIGRDKEWEEDFIEWKIVEEDFKRI